MKGNNINPEKSTSNKPTANAPSPIDSDSEKPAPEDSSWKEPARMESTKKPSPHKVVPKIKYNDYYTNQDFTSGTTAMGSSQSRVNVPQQPSQGDKKDAIDETCNKPPSASQQTKPWAEFSENYTYHQPQTRGVHAAPGPHYEAIANKPPTSKECKASVPRSFLKPDMGVKGKPKSDTPKKG